MMGYVDNKRLIWIPVYNNPCSSCIYHEIISMWSIISIISCNILIDNVDSKPHIFVFYEVLVPWQSK